MLVKRIEHHLRVCLFFYVYDYAHAETVAFLVNVADSVDFFVLDKRGDCLDEHSLVHLIRQLRHDNARARAVCIFLYFGLGAQHHAAAPRLVGYFQSRAAHENAAGRIIGRRQIPHQLFKRNVGIFQLRETGVYDLAQIVRRYVGRHADGNTVRAVDKYVGITAGQHGRLLQGVVEVGTEIHRFLFYIPQKLARDF